MHELLTIHNLMSLLTLTLLEVVLGIDNLVFLTILSNRLPHKQQHSARQIGLSLALVMRLLFLAGVVWMVHLMRPLFSVFDFTFSWRDLILIAGGIFLLLKGTTEIHATIEDVESEVSFKHKRKYATVVVQIVIFDLIFSIDSIMTAVGLTDYYAIMALAIFFAIVAMMFASEPLSKIIRNHPTIKMLALSFLLIIGMVLVADGFQFHIPRGYIYFAIAFSVFVELMNQLVMKKRQRRRR